VFYRRRVPKFIQKAASLATVSQFTKNDITRVYKTDADKIGVVYNGCRESIHAVDEEVKAATRKKYTEGQEYFIYVGSLQPRKNLVRLLKAFSLFKKRQQSGMKLVLAGRPGWKNDEFLQLLSTYKYRTEVVLTHYLEEKELAQLLASAYALVYPSLFEGFGVPVLEAMHSGVPVLTSAGSAMQEVGAEAGLYFDPLQHEDIAEKMMRIYKDEELRKQMIVKGRERSTAFSWQETARLLWQEVQKAAQVS
jgi:glycosyltransferase involved in cell wall biosynthesis